MASHRTPDFLIIGAAKCATTWLQASLSQSDDVYMPAPELHYFSWYFDKGTDWYLEQFDAPPTASIIGEKSNSYLTDPEGAARILDALPDVKLIAQLRDPVERAYSDYCMLYRRGDVSSDIDRHLSVQDAADERFIDHSRYGHHLEAFYDRFPADRILCLDYATVTTDPREQLDAVAQHLGISQTLGAPVKERVKDKTTAIVPTPLRRILKPLRPILDPIRHTAPMRMLRNTVASEMTYPPLSDTLRHDLSTYFASDIARLNELTGKSFFDVGK